VEIKSLEIGIKGSKEEMNNVVVKELEEGKFKVGKRVWIEVEGRVKSGWNIEELVGISD
jgi:hypothetical protein